MDHCEICDAKAEDTHHIEEQNMANSKGLINYYHKNIKDNLVVLCKKCHDNVHNGNLNIKGWLFTSEGKKLDYEYQEQNKCKKKFDTEQIKYILELKDYKQNIAIQMLKENNISISKTTLRKIWNNQY